MREKTTAVYRDLVKRLDTIINILLETARPNGKEIRISKRIEILRDAGLRPAEISKILGKSLSHVTKELVLIRKKKRSR